MLELVEIVISARAMQNGSVERMLAVAFVLTEYRHVSSGRAWAATVLPWIGESVRSGAAQVRD